LPKNLWLGVNEEGIHIMQRRSKEPLISYSYRNIVNYSPSLRNLMIVTESLTRGTKFVFNTSQVCIPLSPHRSPPPRPRRSPI
jgi:hypothetical protein